LKTAFSAGSFGSLAIWVWLVLFLIFSTEGLLVSNPIIKKPFLPAQKQKGGGTHLKKTKGPTFKNKKT